MIKSRSRSAQQSGSLQARIHTGFHRFTEIGQIFHNKYIFNDNKILSKLKLRDEIIRRFARLHPRRMELTKYWLNDVEIQKISRWSIPRTPLQACAFGARLGNRSVFLLLSPPALCIAEGRIPIHCYDGYLVKVVKTLENFWLVSSLLAFRSAEKWLIRNFKTLFLDSNYSSSSSSVFCSLFPYYSYVRKSTYFHFLFQLLHAFL